ncbi:MAG: hypothetical protein ACSLEM_03325 [Candidatus Malihini olakiniferum]
MQKIGVTGGTYAVLAPQPCRLHGLMSFQKYTIAYVNPLVAAGGVIHDIEMKTCGIKRRKLLHKQMFKR